MQDLARRGYRQTQKANATLRGCRSRAAESLALIERAFRVNTLGALAAARTFVPIVRKR